MAGNLHGIIGGILVVLVGTSSSGHGSHPTSTSSISVSGKHIRGSIDGGCVLPRLGVDLDSIRGLRLRGGKDTVKKRKGVREKRPRKGGDDDAVDEPAPKAKKSKSGKDSTAAKEDGEKVKSGKSKTKQKDGKSTARKCHACKDDKEEDAELQKCIECEQLMCEPHRLRHVKSKDGKGHTFQP
eukprot:418825-Rhodomonas_salina.4